MNTCLLQGQIHLPENLGGRIGVQLAFGQPVNRVGVVLNAYYWYDFAQINFEWQGYRNLTNYGPKGKSWERRTGIGLVVAAGKERKSEIPFIDLSYQQTGLPYSFGYAYHYYKSDNQTSQGSGTIALQFDRVHVICENDVFGSAVGDDRFRTGAFSFAYRYDNFLYELQTTLWTGETRGKSIKKYRDEEAAHYPGRWGYCDISDALYGKYSHGVLAAQVSYVMPFGQIAQFGLGIDDERIRHVVQNKIIHDMYFFPAAWTTVRNLHFPMLDKDGNPFCGAEEAEIRDARWFWKMGMNSSRFY